MFKVFTRTKGYKPTLWAAVDKSHSPLALLLPIQITLINGLFYHWTTRAVVYGSVLCAPGSEGIDALKLLLQAYKRGMHGNFLFTELRNLTDLSDLQPVLNDCDFYYEDHMNYLIDLDQSEEILWQNISKSGRQSVRTSKNKGTVIEEVTNREQLITAYQMLQKVYKRVQVPISHISLFEAAYNLLGPKEMFKIFTARVGDHYIGACFILIYNGKIIDWYAGSDRTFPSSSSGELLIWHILQWGKERGVHLFDFGGGGKPSEEYGPRAFKSKFGGKPVYYGRNICIHSPIRFQVSKQVYSWMRWVSLSRAPGMNHQ
jgi:serine/alanine adding enzyme